MSTRRDSNPDDTDDAVAQFKQTIREAFAPYMKSEQALDAENVPREERGPNQRSRHNDGAAIYQMFGLAPFIKHLQAAEQAEHEVSKHPQALAHLVAHVSDYESHQLGNGNEFPDATRLRRPVLEWLAANDERRKRLRPGGTEILLHGEQGTTKTTLMIWLISQIMQLRQRENVLWLSTLDDTEWTALAPFATVALPSDERVRVEANPYTRELRGAENVRLRMTDVARDVIRYDDPRDLLKQLDERTPGQFYVVYPDPQFRRCQSITARSYESVREVEAVDEATNLHHWWFALFEELAHGRHYRQWTTVVSDEAHKWLKKGKGDDEHDWWHKIDDWAELWGDARKKRISAILATHVWVEIPDKVRQKIRWGATMNGEQFPSKAPLDGRNRNQDLGETCIWTPLAWNFVGYPNLPRRAGTTVPAEIKVSYPRWEEAKDARS